MQQQAEDMRLSEIIRLLAKRKEAQRIVDELQIQIDELAGVSEIRKQKPRVQLNRDQFRAVTGAV